jgi:hypothetical protein
MAGGAIAFDLDVCRQSIRLDMINKKATQSGDLLLR